MGLFLQEAINGVSLGATYAVVAIGFGLIFSVMRVINLAHPDFFMLGAYATFASATLILSVAPTAAPVVVLVVMLLSAVIVSCLAGLAVEQFVLRPLRTQDVMVPFIATAGVSIFLENIMQVAFGPDPVAVPRVFPTTPVMIGSATLTTAQILVIASACFVLVMVTAYVSRTRWGLATRAVSERSEISSSCGINVNAVARLTMLVSAGAAGIAGFAVAVMFGTAAPTMGVTFGTKSFVCMLVAGNRSIPGIMAVGLALGIGESLVAGFISSSYRDALTYAALILVLVLRPKGLFGSYSA